MNLLKRWWRVVAGTRTPVTLSHWPPSCLVPVDVDLEPDAPLRGPACDHDDRVDPDGWQLDPNGNGYINVSSGRHVILCHDTGTKRWRRLILCAKCHRGRFEFKSEDLTANWPKVNEE